MPKQDKVPSAYNPKPYLLMSQAQQGYKPQNSLPAQNQPLQESLKKRKRQKRRKKQLPEIPAGAGSAAKGGCFSLHPPIHPPIRAPRANLAPREMGSLLAFLSCSSSSARASLARDAGDRATGRRRGSRRRGSGCGGRNQRRPLIKMGTLGVHSPPKWRRRL